MNQTCLWEEVASLQSEQESEETMPLLHDLQARELVPEVRLVDSGSVSGDALAEHADLGIELLGPLKQEGGWQHETGYGVSAGVGRLAEAAGAVFPRPGLGEMVTRTTQPRPVRESR